MTVPDTIAAANTGGLALNVTAVAPTTTTYLTVWPATDLSKPTVSNLNPSANQVIPNAVVTGIGSTKAFNIYNNMGYTNVVVDVVGTFSRTRARRSPPRVRRPRRGRTRRSLSSGTHQ